MVARVLPITQKCSHRLVTGYYENRMRQPMDDLESLVFSIWYIAGVPLGISNEAEGKVLSNEKKSGNGKARVLVSETQFNVDDQLKIKLSRIHILYIFRRNVNILKIQRFLKHSELFAPMKCY